MLKQSRRVLGCTKAERCLPLRLTADVILNYLVPHKWTLCMAKNTEEQATPMMPCRMARTR